MFYLNSTLNFGIPPVLEFQWEVYYKVERLLAGLIGQQIGTTARWCSNKTSLVSRGNILISQFIWDWGNIKYYNKIRSRKRLLQRDEGWGLELDMASFLANQSWDPIDQ